ncbi:MAG: DUF2834 domain-containing protein [Pseudomonadales bacterium]|jgi:hypothetical protein|nr:DUF2834 domain-containing protein [Pseudomonadales bacterium]
MTRASLYLLLAVLGALVPWLCFGFWFVEAGIGLSFLRAALANGVAAGFTADVVISSLAFWLWIAADAREQRAGPIWPFVLLNLTVGLSCALPAWLLRRERSGTSA